MRWSAPLESERHATASASVSARLHGPGRRWLALVFLATLGVYLLAAVRMLPYVEPPTGDQPHYLMQVISLVEDGDLDLKNNYTTAESYGQFSAPGRRREGFRGIPVGYHLDPTGHIVVRDTEAGEAWYPKHSPGLPVLLVPGWLVGRALTPWLDGLTAAGFGGWPGVVVEMGLIGALLGTQVFLLAWEVTGRRAFALIVWAAVSFSVPQMLLSLMVYPEIVGALVLAFAFRHLVVRPLPAVPWRLGLLGLAVALLPWLNPRFVLVSGGLALLAAVVLWRGGWRGRALASKGLLLLGPLAASLAALRWYQLAIHGSSLGAASQYEGFFVPTMVDGRLGADWQALFLALAGLFVDRQYGLLVFAPIYALAGVGLVALWRHPAYRWTVGALGVIILPYVALTADFRVWWGGWSPPARYLAVLTPLLAVPLARSLLALAGHRPYQVVFAALAGVGVLVAAVLLFQLGDPEVEQAIFGNPSRNPAMLRWLLMRFGIDQPQLLPATASWFGDRRAPIPWAEIVGYLGLLGTLVGLAILALPRGPSTTRRGEAPATAEPPVPAPAVPAARRWRRPTPRRSAWWSRCVVHPPAISELGEALPAGSALLAWWRLDEALRPGARHDLVHRLVGRLLGSVQPEPDAPCLRPDLVVQPLPLLPEAVPRPRSRSRTTSRRGVSMTKTNRWPAR